MTTQRSCGIVITYHPDEQVRANLAALRPQVDDLIVVDNGSPDSALRMLEDAGRQLGLHVIANHENVGIATALNMGVRHAIHLGHTHLFLFDQDSRVTDGFTAAMLRAFDSHIWGDRLGLLVPRCTDIRYGYVLPQQRLPSGALAVAITSGSLLRARTLQQHGLFLDELFIDGVDHEYCLRLRRSGLLIAECPDATLLHSPGTPRRYTVFGKPLFNTTNYTPVRRYYQARNNLWIVRQYLRDFPRFSLGLLVTTAKDLLKIVFAEQDKRRKLTFLFRGVRDGLRGRLGKLESA